MAVSTEILLNALRFIALLTTFGYASYLDHKHRRVQHKNWILPTLFGVFLLNLEVFISFTQPTIFQFVHGTLTAITIGCFIYVAYNQLYKPDSSVTAKLWLIPIAATVTTLILPAIPGLNSLLPFTFTTPHIHYVQLAAANILLATVLGFILFAIPVLGMGGADFLAFIVIGFLLPTRPELGVIPITQLPETQNIAVFTLRLPIIKTITNMGLLLIPYLFYLPLRNILIGKTDGFFLTSFTVETPVSELHTKHGRIIPSWNIDESTSFTDKLKIYFSASGVDTFFLRDYFKWRQETADNPPNSFADETRPYLDQFLRSQTIVLDEERWETDTPDDEEFIQNILKQDTVQLMPGLPLIIPLFGGVLLTLTVGDLMLVLLLALT